MARHKKTARRSWTPLATFGALDEYDDLLGGFDVDSDLDELDDLLGDPLDQVVMAIARPPRPIRASHHELRSQPLTRAWCARVDDCGAGGAQRERGIDDLAAGAVHDLQVGPRRLAASVLGTGRYRVDVEILLPPQADMQATLSRIEQARSQSVGTDPRLAIQRAIQSGGPGLFPSPTQIRSECTCPDGPRCRHVVAAVHAFGVLLDREPEQLLSLWDLDVTESRATAAFVLPPLAPDRRPLVDDLAIFGIDLLDPCEPATGAPAPSPVAATEPAPERAVAPAPEPAPEQAVAPASVPPNQQSEVRRDYLRVIGVSPRTIDAWLRSGVLRKTDRDGVYERTPEANRKIADFLAR